MTILTAAFMRCVSLAAFVITVMTGMAAANDFAERAIIGFSPDGRYFAFEQFGVQDGSGLPYADIFVIDLNKDRWIAGTPVKIRLEHENATPAPAREKARIAVAPVLKQFDIRHPGRIIISRHPGEPKARTKEIRFRPYRFSPPKRHISLHLKTFALPSGKSCKGLERTARGFALKIAHGAKPAREFHRDTKIPGSRYCPLDYAISDVIGFDAPGAKTRLVALISLFQVGFEGADRRFIAVPIPGSVTWR